jgi:hypothetical protein
MHVGMTYAPCMGVFAVGGERRSFMAGGQEHGGSARRPRCLGAHQLLAMTQVAERLMRRCAHVETTLSPR